MIWLMNGLDGHLTRRLSLAGVPANWTIVGTGDFNGDACVRATFSGGDTAGDVGHLVHERHR